MVNRARLSILHWLTAAALMPATAGLLAQQTKPTTTATQAPGRDTGPAQPAGTAVVAGVLTSVDGGHAVRRARVSLSGIEPRYGRTVTTDDQGRFSFTEVPAGQFDLSASKPGYLDVTYGQKQPGSGRAGTPIQLSAGQHMDRVKLGIPKGGVLTGTVVDDQGEPTFGLQVRAMRYVMRTGERTLQSAGSATTDDRGIYRIPSLLPGDYIVSVVPPDDQMDVAMKMLAESERAAQVAMASGASSAATFDAVTTKLAMARAGLTSDPVEAATVYAPVYFPGTTQASAAGTITLGPSEERTGVDVALQLLPVSRVSGVVLASDGQPAASAQVQLIDNGQPLPGMGVRSTRAGTDGKFSFANVVPGQYSVLAKSSPVPIAVAMAKMMDAGKIMDPNMAGALLTTLAPAGKDPNGNAPPAPPQWATADVSADGRGPSSIVLSLRPGMTVSGRIAVESSGPAPDLTRVRVSLPSATPSGDMGGSTVLADASGNFTIVGVVPGRYRVSATGGPAGTRVKSAVAGGRDTLDFPLEIKPGEDVTGVGVTFSDRATTLSGALQDPSGQPATDYTVIVFASDNRFWTPQSRRIQATRPATDGRFAFSGLPAGDYLIVAVTDCEPGQWFDPAFLRPLVGAGLPATLAEGERKTQNLRVK